MIPVTTAVGSIVPVAGLFMRMADNAANRRPGKRPGNGTFFRGTRSHQ
jgi:hypothetical protein